MLLLRCVLMEVKLLVTDIRVRGVIFVIIGSSCPHVQTKQWHRPKGRTHTHTDKLQYEAKRWSVVSESCLSMTPNLWVIASIVSLQNRAFYVRVDTFLPSFYCTWMWRQSSPTWSKTLLNTSASAGPASDLGQGTPHSRPFHPPETPLLLQRSTLNSGPFTFSCQGLFPSTRLNMNIHKQNGSPRLWKLSKTYLHLILKEPPTPTPYRELTTPSYPPQKKIFLNYSRRKKKSKPAIPQPPKILPSCPPDQTIHSPTVGPDRTRPILLGII